jgi:outer membrane immunogenic protein
MLRRISLSLLAATAMGLIASQAASAADLRAPVKAPPPALPPPVQDWSGIYVGLEGGYGWGHQDGFAAPFSLNPDAGEFSAQEGFSSFSEFAEFQQILRDSRGHAGVSLGSTNTSGWLFGAFFGAQKQWGNWVLGIEADVDGADIKGTSSGQASFHNDCVTGTLCSLPAAGDGEVIDLKHLAALETKIDMVSSLRGKVGYAWSPNWMIYGTGGAAFAHVKNTLTSTQSLAFGDDCEGATVLSCSEAAFFNSAFTAQSSQTMLGWTIGAGLDYKWQLDPGSALVFGVEYQYFNFPTQTFTFSGPSGLSVAFDTKETINVVKGKISYLFSLH